MFKVGDEVSVKGEITKVCESGVVVKAHYFGEAYFDRSNMDLIGKTYEQGLSDAWELARKILEMCGEKREEILGLGSYANILEFVKPEEALAKISEYESAKEIKVGDVVKYGVYTCVVTVAYTETAEVLFGDGTFGTIVKEKAEKTGNHIDIESLLRQIGE